MTHDDVGRRLAKLPKKQKELVQALAQDWYQKRIEEFFKTEQGRSKDLDNRITKVSDREIAVQKREREIEEKEKASEKRVKLGGAIEALMAEFAGAQMRTYMDERRKFFF